jgi:hypothetical protein
LGPIWINFRGVCRIDARNVQKRIKLGRRSTTVEKREYTFSA